jgi:hypothetical protein
MSKLQDFLFGKANEIQKNRLLLEWLGDDAKRNELYRELRAHGCPVLPFRSVTSADSTSAGEKTAYLLSSFADVSLALRSPSVAPYAALDSGGRFMLGLDDPVEHQAQHDRAARALRYQTREVDAAVAEAVRIGMLRPLKIRDLDLVDVAEECALRFVEILFGLTTEIHVDLKLAMRAAYTRLTFQIIGRHFDASDGQPPRDSPQSLQIRADLEKFIRAAADPDTRSAETLSAGKRVGEPHETVVDRLATDRATGNPELVFVALGLMAGTIGNIISSVCIVMEDLLARANGNIDEAIAAARDPDPAKLGALIDQCLLDNPPAPFLARRTVENIRMPELQLGLGVRPAFTIPAGSDLLLAMGGESTHALRFGGHLDDASYPHRCIGPHLAWPLVREIVRQVVLLPGLARVVDPATGHAKRLQKRWGAMCMPFPLQYQRDRRLNQQPLHVVLPIKAPVAENALKLELLTQAGAHIVEDSLKSSRHVHFAWFNLVDNRTKLAMSTVYDGDIDAYVEYFALEVPLFDKQFDYLDVDLPRPIRKYPKQFVEVIKKYNQAPLGQYFFSAYPLQGVAGIEQP